MCPPQEFMRAQSAPLRRPSAGIRRGRLVETSCQRCRHLAQEVWRVAAIQEAQVTDFREAREKPGAKDEVPHDKVVSVVPIRIRGSAWSGASDEALGR